jgi:P4 family phage/plasmid primase-like protien
MGVNDYINEFVKKYRVVGKGVQFTHTSMGPLSLSLNIPNEKLSEFYDICNKARLNNMKLHMTEKPTDPSPLRVDLDFRFTTISSTENEISSDFESLSSRGNRLDAAAGGGLFSENSISKSTDEHFLDDRQSPIKRLYTDENIQTIVGTYYDVLSEFIELNDSNSTAYVMEKPEPTKHREQIKDGIHIVFPGLILSNKIQHIIRNKILEKASLMFKGLPIANEYESIVDKAIIDKNNWQMYGSCKPGCLTYEVSSYYTYSKSAKHHAERHEKSNEINTELTYIHLFSMRKTEPVTPIKEDMVEEMDKLIRLTIPKMDKKLKLIAESNVMSKTANIIKNYAKDDELDIAKKLVYTCLNTSRSNDYTDWINTGWALRNIDYRLLDAWIDFSRNSDKYVEGECERLWDNFRKDTMGMGTLRWWCKLDNKDIYDDIIASSLQHVIDAAINSDGAHFDVAMLIYKKYNDEYKAVKGDLWYKYNKNNHRWEKMQEALELYRSISEEVYMLFIDRSKYWAYRSTNASSSDEAAAFENKGKKCFAIALNCKKSSYKSNILKECKCLFTEPKFEELLDSKGHLLGFNNGVYDMKMKVFRDGIPNDYISYSTYRTWVPYNMNSKEAKDIDKFFSEIFLNDNLKRYALETLACAIDGSINQERFYILTGGGSNGKSKIVELIQKCIGDYYCILPISLLTQKRASSNSAQSELERTKGRRFAVMQEPSEGDRINIGLMKELSGNDRIQARGLFKEPIEFKPQFKMFLTCNDLPVVSSDDNGTWRRIRVIEFKSKFSENPDPSKKNEFKMDLNLCDKFEMWADTFICMLLHIHKQIDIDNLFEPPEVKVATEGYKKNNDIIGQFVSEMIVADENTKEKLIFNKVWNEFKSWYSKNMTKSVKSCPDRIQLKTYLEKQFGQYPPKGWKKVKFVSLEDDDSDSSDED